MIYTLKLLDLVYIFLLGIIAGTGITVAIVNICLKKGLFSGETSTKEVSK